MDADELALIEDTLVAAIAKAKIVAKARGVGPQFREIVRHAPRCTTFCATRFAPEDLRLRNAWGPVHCVGQRCR